MSNSKRALRRHHRERLNNRTKKIILTHWYGSYDPHFFEDLHQRAARRRDNMAMCSCWMCGNPRRRSAGWNYDPFDLHEKRQREAERDQWIEVQSDT